MVHIMQAVDTAQKLPVMLVLLNSQMVSLLCARSNWLTTIFQWPLNFLTQPASQPAELSQEQNPSQWSTFSWKKCHKQLFFALIDLYELMEVASEPATVSSMVQPQRSNPIMMPPT